MVAQLAGLDHVADQEKDAKEQAERADDHVGDAEERVLPADDGDVGDDNGFGSAKTSNVEV